MLNVYYNIHTFLFLFIKIKMSQRRYITCYYKHILYVPIFCISKI